MNRSSDKAQTLYYNNRNNLGTKGPKTSKVGLIGSKIFKPSLNGPKTSKLGLIGLFQLVLYNPKRCLI